MNKRCKGFTLIELVVVMVIMGILSAYAASRLNFASHDAGGCVETLKASLRLAQKLAIAQRTSSVVGVSQSCAVTVGTTINPSLNVYAALNGVNVSNFATANFNSQGQPSMAGVLMTAIRTFTISGGDVTRYVCLEPETGYVHEESASCG